MLLPLFAGLFVSLSAALLKKLQMNIHEHFVSGEPWDDETARHCHKCNMRDYLQFAGFYALDFAMKVN